MTSSGGRMVTPQGVTSGIVTVTQPAAGADWTTTLANGGSVGSIVAQFVTSAVVANRFPAFQILDNGGHVLWSVQTPTAQAAGITHTYGAGPGVGMNATGSTVMLPLPSGLVVPAGGIVKSVTTALDAGDQWSAIVLTLAG